MHFFPRILILLMVVWGISLRAQKLTPANLAAIENNLAAVMDSRDNAVRMELMDKAAAIDSNYYRYIGLKAYMLHQAGSRKKALVLYNRFCSMRPNSSFCVYRGKCRAELGDADGAWQDVQKALAISDNYPMVTSCIAEIAKKLPYDTRFSDCYYKIMLQRRTDDAVLLKYSEIKLKQGDTATAVKYMDSCLAMINNRLFDERYYGRILYVSKAASHRALKQYKDEIESTSNAILLFPDEKWLYKNRIDAYIRQGDLQGACADEQMLVNLGEKFYMPKSGVAPCDLKTSHASIAPDWLKRVEAESNYVKGVKEMHKGADNAGDAINYFNKTIAIDPSHLFARSCRARCYGYQKENDRAITDYEYVLGSSPSSFMVLGAMARIYSAKGNSEKALYYANKAVNLSQNDPSAVYMRAGVYQRLHEYRKALADYDMVIKQYPYTYSAYYEKAVIQAYELMDYEAALKNVNKALAMAEDWPILDLPYDYFEVRAFIYDKLARYPEALDEIDTALGFDPEAEWFHLRRGEILARMKDLNAACQEWQRAKELGLKGRVEALLLYNCGAK